jgi:hypothetical protein
MAKYLCVPEQVSRESFNRVKQEQIPIHGLWHEAYLLNESVSTRVDFDTGECQWTYACQQRSEESIEVRVSPSLLAKIRHRVQAEGSLHAEGDQSTPGHEELYIGQGEEVLSYFAVRGNFSTGKLVRAIRWVRAQIKAAHEREGGEAKPRA